MGVLLKSTETFRARALEVDLSNAKVSLLIAQSTDSLVRLAFAACSPGRSLTDTQAQLLFSATHTPGQGAMNLLQRLVFEAQARAVADVKQKVARKKNQTIVLASAEREHRIKDQRTRLSSLGLGGEE